MAYYDWKTQKIKDEVIVLLLGVAVIYNATGTINTFIENILGMLVISIPMLFTTMIRPGAFGGGDIKLMAAGGLYLGKDRMILATEIAIFVAAIYCIWLLYYRRKSHKTAFPFGPFLCIGMISTMILPGSV